MDARDKIIMRSIRLPNGCWEWIGRKHNMGYGRMSFLGNPDFLAHRVAYIVFVGPIPDGLEMDHLCRNRRCVNPAHLEAVTHLENVRRGGKMLKDHCPNGHPFDYVGSNGHRGCRTCDRRQQSESRKRYPDRVKARLDSWKRRNPERVKELQRRSAIKNRERRNAYLREYRKRPEVREKMRQQHRSYVERNREHVNETWRRNYHERKAKRNASDSTG